MHLQCTEISFNSPPDQNKHLFSCTEKALKFSLEKLSRIHFRGMVLRSVVFFIFHCKQILCQGKLNQDSYKQVFKRLCSELLQEMRRVLIEQRGVYYGV